MAVCPYRPVLADFVPPSATVEPPIRLANASLPRVIRGECDADSIPFSDYLARRNLEAPSPRPQEPSRDLACVPKPVRHGLAVDELWLNVRTRDGLEHDETPPSPDPGPDPGPRIGSVSPVEPAPPPERRGPIARILLIPGAVGRFIDLFI